MPFADHRRDMAQANDKTAGAALLILRFFLAGRRKAGRAECNYPDRTELLRGVAADGSFLRAWRCGIGPRVGSVAWCVPDSQLWLVSDRAYHNCRRVLEAADRSVGVR